MRRNKTVTQILLIFSIANLLLAAPAGVQQRGLVTNGPDDDSADGSIHQDVMPESSGSRSPQLNDPLPTPESTPLQDELARSGAPPLYGDSLPASEAAQLHNNPPQASEAAQLHDDPLARPGAAPFPNDSPSVSGARLMGEDVHPSWHGWTWTPVTEIEELPPSPKAPTRKIEWPPIPPPFRWPDSPPSLSLKSEAPKIQRPPLPPPFRWPSKALGASRGSGGSSSGWTEALDAAAEAEAKGTLDHVKPPKGFCLFRCLMPYRRSFEWSPERDLGHHFS